MHAKRSLRYWRWSGLMLQQVYKLLVSANKSWDKFST
jgi:hypothetical protein